MNARSKRLRHAVEYAGVRTAFALTGLLPLRVAGAIGAALGWTAWSVFRVRRRLVIEQILHALGSVPEYGGPAAVGRRSYQKMGRSMMEYTALARLSHADVRSLVRYEGFAHFDAAIEAGRGAVLFAGHFGNWELMGAGFVAHGYPIDFLVGEQTNARVDRVMNDLRRTQGIGIISRSQALKKVLRSLKDNRLVALLADQNVRKNGVFVEFLGRPASTARGPAMFAIKQGAPIICLSVRRVAGGHHLATLGPTLYPDPALSGDDAVVELTQRFTNVLADNIRRYPDEYFWAHRRWKTQPETR